ncbi:Ammonia transporter [uncultured Eubacterium sp.]|uniref:ammonium transporter n=1 Tax=Brotomerdimonas butyrica TaxID=2981721 RepID=UPI0008229DF6|nr:ammonium transporter [Brotomerdimonas butyrica]MCU6756902.1 ammonium transporter [Brotomerdimonas butyrica]SCI06484.1 Ammonia transporter [uncultured Eubacterium sp.]
MSSKPHDNSRNVVFLVVIFIFFVAVAIAFIPAVNENIAEGMKQITGQSIDSGSMNYETGTIFDTLRYNRSIHILAMLLLGFGFLMVVIRGHGYSSITATLLAVSISIPIYMLIKCYMGEDTQLSIDGFMWAEFAAASLLIAIGAPLGRMTMDQYILLAILFVPVYLFNEWLILESGMFTGFQDTGGSVVIHAFGAYFGLGLVAATAKKMSDGPTCETDSTSNQFSLLGSLVLWVFWPSFTSAVASPERVVLTAINTVFALAGATIATYIFSKLIRGKVDIEDIANASLAGGVAIGSTCDIANPGMSMLIGLAAGILSTVGYSIIAPKIQKLIRGTDTCGVHNLHGMPGLLGGLSAIIITGNAGTQIICMIITVAVAFVGGRIVGAITGLLGRKQELYSDLDEFGH